MPRIECDYAGMNNASSELLQNVAQMQRIAQDIERIKNQLPLSTSFYRVAKTTLHNGAVLKIGRTARNVSNLANALDTISRKYDHYDSKLAGESDIFEAMGKAFDGLINNDYDFISRHIDFMMKYADKLLILPIAGGIAYSLLHKKELHHEIESKLNLFSGEKMKGERLHEFNDDIEDHQKNKHLYKDTRWNSDDNADYKARRAEAARRQANGENFNPDAVEYISRDGSGFASREMDILSGQKQRSVSVFSAEGAYQNGLFSSKGDVDVLKAEYHYGGGLGVYEYQSADGKYHHGVGVYGEIGGSASIFESQGEVRYGNQFVGGYAKGSVKAGSVSGTAGINCAMTESGPQLYAGGKIEAVAAEISGSAGVSVLGTDVGVSGSLKVGVGANLEAGIKDGHFVLNMGASLGVGFDVGIDVDVSGTMKVIGDNWNNICDGADKAFDFVGDKLNDAGNAIKDFFSF